MYMTKSLLFKKRQGQMLAIAVSFLLNSMKWLALINPTHYSASPSDTDTISLHTHTKRNKVIFECLGESLICVKWHARCPWQWCILWLHSVHLIIMFPPVDQTARKTLWMKSISELSFFFVLPFRTCPSWRRSFIFDHSLGILGH